MSEKEFLENYDIHKFDLPLTSVDVVIFTVKDDDLQVLLVKRARHPYQGVWGLPGGFVNVKSDKDLESVALRNLLEKTAVSSPYLEQLQCIGSSDRDPRGWSVTIVYFALISSDEVELKQGKNVEEVAWWKVGEEGVDTDLAFDHQELIDAATERLRNKVEYTALPIHLLSEEFTLSELQRVYEIVLGRPVDKSGFRKRILGSNVLKPLKGKFKQASNRPAQLYAIDKQNPNVFFQRTLGITAKKGK